MEKNMILSDDTLNVLKNFATINPNLVFKPGQRLSTISEAKTIMAKAEIVEDFPQEFGIYDLNEFLSVCGLIENPQLNFEEKSVLISNTVGGDVPTNQQKINTSMLKGIYSQHRKKILVCQKLKLVLILLKK